VGKGILISRSGDNAIPVKSASGSNLVAHLGLAIGLRD
jgi:hypothetical protein